MARKRIFSLLHLFQSVYWFINNTLAWKRISSGIRYTSRRNLLSAFVACTYNCYRSIIHIIFIDWITSFTSIHLNLKACHIYLFLVLFSNYVQVTLSLSCARADDGDIFILLFAGNTPIEKFITPIRHLYFISMFLLFLVVFYMFADHCNMKKSVIFLNT